MTASAEGRDYSAYQAPLTAADLSGLSFAFTKVTNGLTEIDPHLARNWAVLGSWGKPRGGYHELVGSASATAQGTYYMDAIKANGGLRPGDILAVVASDYPGVTDADVKAWCDKVRSLAGPQHPIVAYTDLDVAKTLVATSGHYDLWVAWPSSSAPGPSQWAPAKWKTWRFWQWGTEGGVDADAFNGTAAQLDQWIASYSPQTGPFRHVTTAGQTLAGIAAARNTTAEHIAEVTLTALDSADIGTLSELPLPAGFPYYTTNP